MTAFEDLERGDIIWAADPLSEKGRPLLVLGAPRLPTHGVQLITVLVSTKTYHEEALTLRDEGYEGEPLGERSHVLPWALATLNDAAAVDYYMTSLVDDRTEDVTAQLIGYISSWATRVGVCSGTDTIQPFPSLLQAGDSFHDEQLVSDSLLD